MTQPDPRADEFIRQLAADVARLILAVASNDTERLVDDGLNPLLCTIRAHLATLSERPSDAALRRVLARLG